MASDPVQTKLPSLIKNSGKDIRNLEDEKFIAGFGICPQIVFP